MSFSSPAGGPIASAFVEVTANTDPADREIDSFIDSLSRIDEAAERAGEGIENAFREAARQADEALDNIGGAGVFTPVVIEAELAGERIDNSFREAATQSKLSLASIGTAGTLLAGGLAVAGAAVVGFGIQSAASLEQTQIGFEALLGSAEEADAFIRELQQFAATTPFEFPGLANNTRQLLATSEALGITREELIPTIGTIGDLTAVLGQPPESIDRVVRALGQMASRGRVTSEEMLQLTEALPGFQPFQAMAGGLGLTTTELQDQISKGLIPAEEGVQALLQGMREFPGAAGAMAEQAQTLNGLLSTFKDTVGIELTNAFQPLIPTIKTTLAEATPVIGEALGQLAPALSTIAGGVLNSVLDVFAGLTPGLTALLSGIGNLFVQLGPTLGRVAELLSTAFAPIGRLLTAVGGALEPILVTLAELAAVILPPLIDIISTVIEAFTPFIQIIGDIVQRLATAFAPVLGTIADIFVQLGDQVAKFFDSLIESGVIDTFAGAFERLAPVLGEVAEIIGGALIEVFEKLAPSLQTIIELFAERFAVVMEALAPVLPELATAVAEIAVALADLLVALLPLIIPMIEFQTLLIEKIGAPTLLLIAQAIAIMATALARLTEIIITGAGPALQVLTDVLQFLWENILVPLGNFLQAVFVPIIQVLVAVAIGPLIIAVSIAVEIFKLLWNNVLVPFGNFLSSVFKPVVDRIAEVFRTVTNVLQAQAKPAVDAFRGAINTAKSTIDTVRGAINTAIGVIRDTFTPVINAAKDAFNVLGDAINAVKRFLKNLLGPIEDAIGAVGDLISKLGDIPGAGTLGNVIGGVGNVLGLQSGGVIDKDTLALLHSPEVVIPLNDPARALALASGSGLLDQLASAAGAGGIGAGGGFTSGGGGVNIGTVQVNFQGPVTASDAQLAADAFVDGVEATLRRRQLQLTVRTI